MSPGQESPPPVGGAQGGRFQAWGPSELAPPAPRTPSAAAKKLVLGYQGKERVLLWIGGIFLLLGLPFCFIFLAGVTSDLRLFVGAERASATVTSLVLETSYEINGAHPTRIGFAYQDLGVRREAQSYTTRPSVLGSLEVGGPVEIEHLPGSAGVARVVGTTVGPLGPAVAFVLIFPLAGAALLGWAIQMNQRQVRAYRSGRAVRGLVRSRGVDETVSSNGEHPTKIVWEFQVDGRPYQGELSSFEHMMLRQVVPTDEVVVVYDPAEPKHNTLYF
jgi:Predicted membrane protein